MVQGTSTQSYAAWVRDALEMTTRLAMLCLAICSALAVPIAIAAERPSFRRVDERRAAQVGIRKIVGQHLQLYTDLPASNAVDELPLVFDKAVQQWAAYFGVDKSRLANWRMQGFLMQDRAKFAALGLMPEGRTDFVNGYAWNYELWLDEQPSNYYRRHLLLHEGTHGFMQTQLGGAGAGWYREGMAELLGTHRWKDANLTLASMPASRKEVPMWGRIKLVRDAYQAGEALTLGDVMAFNSREAMSTDQYAWCWAMCKFFDSHLQLREQFRQLTAYVADPKFNLRFRKLFRQDWEDLQFEWNAFLATLDYGYDARRMTISHTPAVAVEKEDTITVVANRGWQSTGWRLKAGQAYHIAATGTYQIAKDSQPWPCEPGGVTLEYHEGQPLGRLLGLLRNDEEGRLPNPIAIGLQTVIKPAGDATLYLRVNDSPARLFDNKGKLQVTIEPK